ncbi:phosphatase PAP2 family protein [Lapillicoccus sp.]|uniref:phosphatase PAP2 family protein n=1 Tax=Lapillicoccus sp. TaxID=1909287 RepID=UPI0039838EE8
MDTLVVAVANYALYAVALGAVVAWLLTPREGKLQLAVAAVIAAVAVLVAVKVAGAVWADPRPFVVDGRPPLIPHAAENGFPSDHTTTATAIAVVVLSARRMWGAALLALALALGLARVAAHVHHVPDIVGGIVIGALCGALGVLLARRIVASVGAHGALRRPRTRPARPDGRPADDGLPARPDQ